MKNKYYYFFIFVIFNCNFVYPRAIDKVLISGLGGQHHLDVKTAFYLGYCSYNNSQFPGEVFLYTNNLQSSFDYADQNNFDLIVRSSTGLSSALQIASDYPSIKLVMPSGSNNFQPVYLGDVINSPILITGAGVDSNVTGYQLEFYSEDPITGCNLSSFSNGYIAGQLTFIANILGCSLDSARSLAREKSSQDGVFDIYNGFGKIVTEKLVSGALPVELSSFTGELKNEVIKLNWRTETEVNNYGFEIERNTPLNPLLRGEAEGRGVWEKVGFIRGNENSNSPKLYSFLDDNLLGVSLFQYRLKQLDNDGQYEYSQIVEIELVLSEFALYQNYPNPFNPSTKIRYQLPQESRVIIKIYTILGSEVSEILNEKKQTGIYEVEFNKRNLPSGTYIYRIMAGNFVETKKMTLLK